MIAHVKGTFKTFDASIYTVGNDFTTAEIDIWIDPSTITTGDEKRDEHLKSADFFDVKKNKQITFRSNTMGKAVLDDNHELWGTLTMNGITKNFQLNVHYGGMITDPWGKERAGFTVTGKINRNDWELKWNTEIETGFMVSEEVIITCEFQVVRADLNEMPGIEDLSGAHTSSL